jgi:hypothetical protein
MRTNYQRRIERYPRRFHRAGSGRAAQRPKRPVTGAYFSDRSLAPSALPLPALKRNQDERPESADFSYTVFR